MPPLPLRPSQYVMSERLLNVGKQTPFPFLKVILLRPTLPITSSSSSDLIGLDAFSPPDAGKLLTEIWEIQCRKKPFFFPRKEKEMRLNCCWSVEGGGELFLLPPSLKCHKKKSNFAVFSNFFFRNLCPWSPSFTYPIKLSLFSPQLFKRKKHTS